MKDHQNSLRLASSIEVLFTRTLCIVDAMCRLYGVHGAGGL
jgi:hypothetical protein